ncbi:MAG: FAD-dependent oxidoreductase, partial [Alphaproteobacteria bacterium]|nr:FAD-dependent oxidoreductase [Alphaproteobacteria bacterium]
GLWSRDAAAMARVEAPVWPCEHFYLLTKPVDGISGNMPTLSDHDSHLYVRDDSGGLLVGCFEPMGKPIDPEALGEGFAFQLLQEDWDHFEPMMLAALHRLPALETAEVKTLLNGPESFTPDGSFLLGESAETCGLFLGCGMNSMGVATGGGAGMALAHCILHGHPPGDLHEADPKRFPDCFNSAAALAARVPEVLGKHYEITYPGRQWTTGRMLATTPLHEKWVEAGACFGQFFGIERPLYFGAPAEPTLTFGRSDWFDTIGAEVRQAHEAAALFDQSTLGKIDVTGTSACAFLNRVCANQMDRPAGRAIYTSMLNARGGIESDLTAVRLAEDRYRLYVGTTAIKRDLAWLSRHMRGDESVTLTNVTAAYAVIALMGPQAANVADAVGAENLNDLKYFRAESARIAGADVTAVRLSYVGEAGWEITCGAEDAAQVYEALYAAGARPAGLFAQSSMRIEKGFPAYGDDLDTDVSPLEAGLDFAVAWDTDFIGRDALLAVRENPRNASLVTIVLDDVAAVPLGNEPVYRDGEIIGKTTSAAFGYRVGKPVALAYLDSSDANALDGQQVGIEIARTPFTGAVSRGPAYDPTHARMRKAPKAAS